MSKKRLCGFTLLEVLIALAVLAISAMALSRQMGNGLQAQQTLAQKTQAAIIAENEIASLLLSDNWNAFTDNNKEIELFNNSWQVETVITSTTDPLLRQIVVTVKSPQGQPIYDLTAFKGRY